MKETIQSIIEFESKKYEVKRIKHFKDYFITNDGQVFSCVYHPIKNKNKQIHKLKPQYDTNGYVFVDIRKNKKRNLISVHRLVAETFIPNPQHKREVNHKNGIKDDNRAENLNWASRSENLKHSFNVLHRKPTWLGKHGGDHPSSKLVFQIKDGIVIAEYSSVVEASEKTKINEGNIGAVCRGYRKTAGGYSWKYK